MSITQIKKLEETIESKKKQINQLKEKRKRDIGKLAIKAGLDKMDNKTLQEEFEAIARKHANN